MLQNRFGSYLCSAFAVWLACAPLAAQAQAASADEASGGPVQLRQPAPAASSGRDAGNSRLSPLVDDGNGVRAADVSEPRLEVKAPADPFETYLRKTGSPNVRRFGSELVTGAPQELLDGNALVPPDYVVAAGDELQLVLWGSVDANLRLLVDRSGQVTIPRVGAVMVAGTRYADLSGLISQRVSQVFRNYQLSVSLGRVRNVRVYVTGYVQRPGAYTVGGLSTIVAALMRAGGPAAAGSFRHIELRRGKQVVTNFDLYDLLLRGDKSADRVLQADDVIHVSAVGAQVALVGSVNKPAIFELKQGDTYGDVIEMAGSFSAVADRTRIAVERLADRQAARIAELSLPEGLKQQPLNGDVMRVFSVVEATLPVARQNKRVKVEGEVQRPGEYVLPATSSVRDALRAAGGLTPTAFLFGTEFNRESVRRTQQENYDRALRDMETEFSRAQSTQRALNADEAATFEARNTATQRLVERLRAIKPTGRVVLQLKPETTELPELALEDGDQIYVPAKPTTVGVFGSVFNGGSYLYENGSSIDEFLRQAGGPTKGADSSSTFVVRANGSVVSNQQKTTFLGFGGGVGRLPAMAGDTVFVPEEMNKTTWVQDLKEWTQIFYQFGIGAAAVRTLGN